MHSTGRARAHLPGVRLAKPGVRGSRKGRVALTLVIRWDEQHWRGEALVHFDASSQMS